MSNVFDGFDVVIQCDGALFGALFGDATRSCRLLLCRNDPTLCLFGRESLCDFTLDADHSLASPLTLVRLARDETESRLLRCLVLHVASSSSSVDDIPRWSSALSQAPERSLVLFPSSFVQEHAALLAFNGLFSGDSFSGWTLLQWRAYSVREANVFDLEALVRLEQFWDSSTLQSSEGEILRRLSEFPEGQLVLEVQGSICAVLYSQRLANALSPSNVKAYAELPSLAAANGNIIQFLAALSDPKWAQSQPAHFLLQHALNLFFCRGFRCVQAVTRWSQFASWKEANPSGSTMDYFSLRDEDGLSVDATVRWHQRKN